MCWAAWASGRTVIRSMFTCGGSEAIQADALGDVVGRQRVGYAGVDRVGPLPVAAETGQRELVGRHHPGETSAIRTGSPSSSSRIEPGIIRSAALAAQ